MATRALPVPEPPPTHSSAHPARSRVFGLDVLRAVAIACVLLSHARFFLVPLAPDVARFRLLGFLGVELFFVLSGFLIGGLLLDQGDALASARGLGRFWYRRWMRTLPNYALFLAVNVGVAHATSGLLPPLTSYLVFGQNLTSAVPGFFLESWSLAVEEWFYLLFPLGLAVLVWLTGRVRTSIVALATAFLVLPTGFRWVVSASLPWDVVRQLVPLRLDALMYGVLAVCLARWWPGPWARRAQVAGVIGIGAMAAALSAAGHDLEHPFGKTWIFSALSLGVACTLPALQGWRSHGGRAAATTRTVARWSYALYLANLPVAAAVNLALGPARTGSGAGLRIVLFLTGSMAVAAAVYRYVEKPIMDLRDR